MGNEESTMLDDSVQPKTLESRTLGAIADYIKSGDVKKIAVMTGAGISTAAGSTSTPRHNLPFRSSHVAEPT